VPVHLKILRAVTVVMLLCWLSAAQDDAARNEDAKSASVPAPAISPGQNAPGSASSIQDNSFLIEEAYNQEDGVIQHIGVFQHSWVSSDWVYTLTDEWPVRGRKHQLSLSISGVDVSGFTNSGLGWGDTALNYRYQLIGDGQAKIAIAPRLTVLMPTGDWKLGRGTGSFGLQTNFPVSIQHGRRLVTHWNAGATWIPRARNSQGQRAGIVGVNLGQSFVWLASSRINALLETTWSSTEQPIGNGITERRHDVFISPGVRWAYNFKNGLQIVPGVGLPVGVGPASGNRALILYLSFEHPFRWVRSNREN
jgi:hypothetical protein